MSTQSQSKKFKHILLVDDDQINNFINTRLIKKLNLSEDLSIALNGEEAIKFLEEYSSRNDGLCPDLILLDINMPVMDGFDFLHHFKTLKFKNINPVKLVILTTSSSPSDVQKSKNFEVQNIIKPLTAEKLSKVLTEYDA